MKTIYIVMDTLWPARPSTATGRWCNGNTSVSKSEDGGSTPPRPAMDRPLQVPRSFVARSLAAWPLVLPALAGASRHRVRRVRSVLFRSLPRAIGCGGS